MEKKRFRPLLGFFIFQYFITTHIIKNLLVSVPYWGSLYFNNDYLFLFTHFDLPVSVPYWGSLYFNRYSIIKVQCQKVSVPYWGSLYFNPVLRSPYNYRAAKPDCGAKPNPAFTI